MRCCARVGVGLAPPLALLAMELGVGRQPLDTDGSQVKSGGDSQRCRYDFRIGGELDQGNFAC